MEYIKNFIKDRFHFYKYDNKTYRTCRICGHKQINIVAINTKMYTPLQNNWVDLP